MVDWLGIGHLFELSRTEATLGFFTPLAIFAVFFLAQLILPGRWVPGYVINPETGEPRRYRLNGILVFLVALIVWALELTGIPQDWFYRSSIYAVAGGTVFTTIFTFLGVFSQPPGKVRNLGLANPEARGCPQTDSIDCYTARRERGVEGRSTTTEVLRAARNRSSCLSTPVFLSRQVIIFPLTPNQPASRALDCVFR